MGKERNKNKRNGKNNKSFDNKKDNKCDSRDKFEEKDSRDGKPTMNDARWYMPSDFIMEQHDYAMEGVLGIPFDLSDKALASDPLPTVMRIEFAHTPGDTSRDILNYDNPKSAAINIAAKYLYTTLSARNKKTTNYQPQDIALAIFAESELIQMFALGMRAYGVALQLNSRNRAVPRRLLEAMGFDPDDFMNNMTYFRSKYNILVQAANALKFVSNIKEFEKAWALFGNYWAEENSDMCQYYVPTFKQIGEYTETPAPDDPTTLVKTIHYVPLDDLMTTTSYLNHLKKMIDNLQTSSLMNYVYSDLINYMAEEGASPYMFSLLPDFFVIAPVYSELFNTQVHNIEIKGEITVSDVTQDPTNNIIETHISQTNVVPAWDIASVIDFPYTNNPSVEEKIDAVMFKTPGTNSIKDSGTGTYSPAYHVAVDYIPTKLKIYLPGDDHTLTKTHFDFSEFTPDSWLAICANLSKFRSAPLLYIYMDSKFKFTIGEQNTVTRLKYSDIKELYDQAVLGLFTLNADKAFSSEKSVK